MVIESNPQLVDKGQRQCCSQMTINCLDCWENMGLIHHVLRKSAVTPGKQAVHGHPEDACH